MRKTMSLQFGKETEDPKLQIARRWPPDSALAEPASPAAAVVTEGAPEPRAGQASYAMSGALPWSHYFPFPAGASFEVDGPGPYNGTGKALVNQADSLTFEIHMPARSLLGISLPKLDLTLDLTYRQEGNGNRAVIDFNGNTISDTNVKIQSSGKSRTLIPSVPVPGHTLDKIVVEAEDDKSIDLDITVDGDSHDFDLKRS